MAANVSARKLRSEVLASPATDFHGHRLSLNCATAGCGGEGIFPIAGMLKGSAPTQTIRGLVALLRCRVCGKAPTAVILESGPEIATRGRMSRLSLVGPELMVPNRKTTPAAGQRFAVSRADGRPMACAGLWGSFTWPDGRITRTCCVITTEPNLLVAPIHDRMPVVLEEADWPWVA